MGNFGPYPGFKDKLIHTVNYLSAPLNRGFMGRFKFLLLSMFVRLKDKDSGSMSPTASTAAAVEVSPSFRCRS